MAMRLDSWEVADPTESFVGGRDLATHPPDRGDRAKASERLLPVSGDQHQRGQYGSPQNGGTCGRGVESAHGRRLDV